MRRNIVTLGGMVLALVTPGGAANNTLLVQERLDNGLHVIIAPDASAPLVSVVATYQVGSRDDPADREGLAHLTEHAVNGSASRSLGPGEGRRLILDNGGEFVATTGKEFTRFSIKIPSNQLPLALFWLAEVMGYRDISQEVLDTARNAVQQERRGSIDSVPYTRAFLALQDLAYEDPAYKRWVTGSIVDLEATTLGDVTEFANSFYLPSNAAISVVGDVSAAAALGLVRKYFAALPAKLAPRERRLRTAALNSERRKTVVDPIARTHRLDIAYVAPTPFSRDEAALRLVAILLANGRSARLYSALVLERTLASTVAAAANGLAGPGLFVLGVTAMPGVAIQELENSVGVEIAKLQTERVNDSELGKARNLAKRSLLAEVTGFVPRATLLARTIHEMVE